MYEEKYYFVGTADFQNTVFVTFLFNTTIYHTDIVGHVYDFSFYPSCWQTDFLIISHQTLSL